MITIESDRRSEVGATLESPLMPLMGDLLTGSDTVRRSVQDIDGLPTRR